MKSNLILALTAFPLLVLGAAVPTAGLVIDQHDLNSDSDSASGGLFPRSLLQLLPYELYYPEFIQGFLRSSSNNVAEHKLERRRGGGGGHGGHGGGRGGGVKGFFSRGFKNQASKGGSSKKVGDKGGDKPPSYSEATKNSKPADNNGAAAGAGGVINHHHYKGGGGGGGSSGIGNAVGAGLLGYGLGSMSHGGSGSGGTTNNYYDSNGNPVSTPIQGNGHDGTQWVDSGNGTMVPVNGSQKRMRGAAGKTVDFGLGHFVSAYVFLQIGFMAIL